MTIRVWEYLEEYKEERKDILKIVDKVFSSGVLVLGEGVRKFEEEYSTYCCSADAVGVDNATNGIFLALKALNIGLGDEVITVSNTAVPTVSAIAQAGASAKFVDIKEDSFLMDVSQLESQINKSTKAVIVVHLYGQCVDMKAVKKVCKKHNLFIIEDCSQSHGAEQNGVKCGAMGDMGIFSFYPTKPLGGYGDGGIITCRTKTLGKKLRSLRFYGMKGVYYAEEKGYNSRLDEVHAEILRYKLKKLDNYILKRKELAKRYDKAFEDTNLITPIVQANNSHVFYVYVVKHKQRDNIIKYLNQKDIFLNISYPWPIHIMRGYKYLGYKKGDLPKTEKVSKQIFSLPMFPSLTFNRQDKVIKEIKNALSKFDK